MATSTTNSSFLYSIKSGPHTKPRKWLTWLAEFVALLEKSGVPGPLHFRGVNLYQRGRYIGGGSQFEVFEDEEDMMSGVVRKRVRRNLTHFQTTEMMDMQSRLNLRTLELEILTLGRPEVRLHPNIVRLVQWGFDYPSGDQSLGIPVLIVEKAFTSLSTLL